MASVTFTPDSLKPPLDARLEELAQVAATEGRPLRVRIQPDIYDYAEQRNQTWYGLIWTVELQDVEEGRRLREGLTHFFRKFGESPESQTGLLKWLKNGKPKPVVTAEGPGAGK